MKVRPSVVAADISAVSVPTGVPGRLGDRIQVTHTQRTFASVPIPVASHAGTGFPRADIIVSGLEHGGPSYEVRIFLNNPSAAAQTPPTALEGYAGSIHVHGYGAPPPPRPGDDGEVRVRPSRSVVATDAVRAQARRAGAVSVTLVAIVGSGATDIVDLHCDDVTVRIAEGATPA